MEIRALYKVWLKRQITPLGRVAVLKSLILSKIIHLWMLLPNPPDNLINELQKTVFQFVWNRKQDRISRKIAVRSIAKGGLGIPNIKTYINALKLIWIRKLKTSEHKWKSKSVSAGVPQGSVLGPLLFLIYINDIVNNIQSVIKLFADDTSLSLALNNPDSRAEILNHDLEKINEWAKKWKVRFNEEKTEQLNFTRGQNQNQQLTFGSKTLKETPSHKHLGVILQNNCRWDEHIRSVINKIKQVC